MSISIRIYSYVGLPKKKRALVCLNYLNVSDFVDPNTYGVLKKAAGRFKPTSETNEPPAAYRRL